MKNQQLTVIYLKKRIYIGKNAFLIYVVIDCINKNRDSIITMLISHFITISCVVFMVIQFCYYTVYINVWKKMLPRFEKLLS